MARTIDETLDRRRVELMRQMLADQQRGAQEVRKRFGDGATGSKEYQEAARQVRERQRVAQRQREARERAAADTEVKKGRASGSTGRGSPQRDRMLDRERERQGHAVEARGR